MMKRNENKYPTVIRLPINAILVSEYAKAQGITVSSIYMRVRRKTNDFKIVNFQTMNFIIPKK